MAKVILVNPASQEAVYRRTKIKTGVPYSPNLTLAVLAASLGIREHQVKIIDLNMIGDNKDLFQKELNVFSPDYVGITFTTPLFNEMVKIAQWVKEYDNSIRIIGGGAHASSLPEETLTNSSLDIVVMGEGDFTLVDIIENDNLKSIPGICYKNGDKIIRNPARNYIENLDILPYPAWYLYDLIRYKTTKLLARKNPVGWVETSRGCVYSCSYCNKSVFGRAFRVKSFKRVVDEIEYMLRLGFKEIHIADDMFTTNIERAKRICEEIIKRGLKFPWAPVTGIRVDPLDQELLEKMRQAGCYRIYFGIESGNQMILDRINKRITLAQIKKAVEMCKKVGLETFGFFMLALPGETEKTMEETINFAKELNLDMAKVSITIPLPATPLYEELNQKGLINTNDWSKYNLYIPSNQVYNHPNLNWKIIEKYFAQFYRAFYLRPNFIFKRLIKNFLNKQYKQLFYDLWYFLKTRW